MKKDWWKLLLSVLLTFGTGALGAIATTPKIQTWYEVLRKPAFNPPNNIFGPVWSLLYVLMAVSLFLVWRSKTKLKKSGAITWFMVQLILNLGWSWLFFGIESPGLALIEIVILWWTIFGTIKSFWKISKVAAWLMIPYLAWVTFAAWLNANIFWLN